MSDNSAPDRTRRLVPESHQSVSPLLFGALAMLLGGAAGLGAFGFRRLIALFHNLAFLGRPSLVYDSTRHTPSSPWGWGVALVPAIGAIGVVYLVETFAPEARGHGVPEVMDAIYYNKSRIRPMVAAIKALASALSIGTGGSVGREGPIIQIGAAFASLLGRAANVSRWQAATLVAAGGGAGIAATFNTPLGGVLFAVEVLLHEVSARTLVPVALATATATYVGRYLFGDEPAFRVPPLHVTPHWSLLPMYVGLGLVTALISIVFIRSLYGTEDVFARALPRHPYVRHAVGMLIVGVAFTWLWAACGHYYVQGVGYATILDVLTGASGTARFLLVLFVVKLIATSLTLGSGASGGIFSPSLFMGATIGAAYGTMLQHVLPWVAVPPAVFALAGMAGTVAGATGAALTAVVMMFEMTLDYTVILPMTLTVAVSHGLRRLLQPESIYTLKLVRRGHVMPEALQTNAHLVHHVGDIAAIKPQICPADASPAVLHLSEESAAGDAEGEYVVVVDDSRIVGVIARSWALAHPKRLHAAVRLDQLVQRDYVTVSPDTTLFDLLAVMQRANASVALVVRRTPTEHGVHDLRIEGVISKADITEAFAEGLEIFRD